jgi:hypothetical protein
MYGTPAPVSGANVRSPLFSFLLFFSKACFFSDLRKDAVLTMSRENENVKRVRARQRRREKRMWR